MERPYFGGGMYLTPPDMLKYGQLYLQKGVWEGQQLLSEEWVEASFTKYGPLLNVRDQNQYGYLWWHHTYQVGDHKIESWEARGAGGQYICVMPDLEVVMAITSGNFRNGRTKQPETIIEQYLLPALLD
ncbi:MAG: 6-aminohexanoate hydrolase, partial [Bacteroidota bacterium]